MIVPQSPKREPDIKLEKYVNVPETVGDETSSLTPEINPELQSRWANMHLGFSRFRKRLEITSHAHEPPVVPLSEGDFGATKQKQTVVGFTDSPLTAAQIYVDKPEVDPANEEMSSLPSIPHIRRYLDIKAPTTLQEHLYSSSSSKNEAESTDYSEWRGRSHDLSLESPYGTQTVETQATTEKNSNNSKDETCETEMTEAARTSVSESPIQYRRLIMKASSPPNDTSTEDRHTDVMTTLHGSSYSTRYQLPYTARYQNPYVAPETTSSPESGNDTPPTRDSLRVNIMTTKRGSSDSAKYPSLAPRPFRKSTEGPSAEKRWTELRTHFSDLSKHPDLPSPLEEIQKTEAGSFTQKHGNASVTRSLNLSGHSLSPSSIDEMWKGTSEKDRRGLSALKAMSSERQTWDKDEKVNPSQPSSTSGNSKEDSSEVLISYSSASTAEDIPHNILQYRTHAPLIRTPPTIPTTSLSNEAVELTWDSKSSYTPSLSQV
ncbi:uncharacterized protein LOC119121787 [Syngnathus acus]|uniref:uncharacterized protein LOC119121787 n=1 Tax=Syngnathus acus TaxID=161584 RepID=UPI0018860C87|nr:uncharacterized protein LOC119121787 [Syngnathus acus]